ncbi:NAD(P)-dependent oxidoreductase [Frankia sp. CiP3]|uniref:NAD(P)-dependent oxidoreductase n=1 Tax=Frankia sp. CiP3 TaxID=2880971 RepID=UPI001EF47631|nr:NAD(P)H-binding protein [Frankia sp. CiP3]
MSRVVVFGAGGNAGRRAVAEAVNRGHSVTAVVRDPKKYEDLAAVATVVVQGDVTDSDSVASVSAGHDAAISTVFRADVAADEFYGDAARALVAGLAKAGVTRLVAVGVGTTLEVSPGVAVHDTPGFPEAGRDFSVGHAVELGIFLESDKRFDWVILTPPPAVLDAAAERTGKYRIGGTQVLPSEEGVPAFAYADLAVALVDEVESPRFHRELVAVG